MCHLPGTESLLQQLVTDQRQPSMLPCIFLNFLRSVQYSFTHNKQYSVHFLYIACPGMSRARNDCGSYMVQFCLTSSSIRVHPTTGTSRIHQNSRHANHNMLNFKENHFLFSIRPCFRHHTAIHLLKGS